MAEAASPPADDEAALQELVTEAAEGEATVETALSPGPLPKMDLMAQIAAMTMAKDEAVSKAASTSAELEKKTTRQRRKSRELEQDAFGMHLTDVEQLRKLFESIDTDKSGTIEVTELRDALIKAGKQPTEQQCRDTITKYCAGSEHMTFPQFQKMIAEWDDAGPAPAPA